MKKVDAAFPAYEYSGFQQKSILGFSFLVEKSNLQQLRICNIKQRDNKASNIF